MRPIPTLRCRLDPQQFPYQYIGSLRSPQDHSPLCPFFLSFSSVSIIFLYLFNHFTHSLFKNHNFFLFFSLLIKNKKTHVGFYFESNAELQPLLMAYKMGKNAFVLLFGILLFFNGVYSVSATSSPASK